MDGRKDSIRRKVWTVGDFKVRGFGLYGYVYFLKFYRDMKNLFKFRFLVMAFRKYF